MMTERATGSGGERGRDGNKGMANNKRKMVARRSSVWMGREEGDT